MKDTEPIFTYERVEELAAAWEPSSKKWVFRPANVSSYFTYAMTKEWPDRVYADYYVDFWDPMLEKLKAQDGVAATILLDIKYQIGQETEETIRQLMQEWVDLQPGYLTVSQPTKNDEDPKFVHFHIRGTEVTNLKTEA